MNDGRSFGSTLQDRVISLAKIGFKSAGTSGRILSLTKALARAKGLMSANGDLPVHCNTPLKTVTKNRQVY